MVQFCQGNHGSGLDYSARVLSINNYQKIPGAYYFVGYCLRVRRMIELCS